MKFKVSKYNEKDEMHLMEILSFLWTRLSVEERKAKINWRYFLNPFSETPLCFLAFYKNKIAGFRAMVTLRAKLNNKEFFVYSPADAIVHPDFRRKGIFSQMTATLLDELNERGEGIILNLSCNEKSSAGNLKLGWVKANSLRLYAYKISIFNFIERKLRKNQISEPVLPSEFSGRTGKLLVSKNIDIEEILKFRVLYPVKDSFAILRNFEFYNWRYRENPREYYFCQLFHNGELTAYCILRKCSETQFAVEEYHSAVPHYLKTLLKRLQQELTIPVIRLALFSDQQKKEAQLFGMIPESPAFLRLGRKKRFPILLRSTKKIPAEEDYFINHKDVREMDNWTLYASDVH